jgi:hypothetical protein
VLGWLHVLWGAFGILTGLALCILSAATVAAFVELGADGRSVVSPAAWFLLVSGVTIGLGGAIMAAAGRLVLRGAPQGRLFVLLLSALNLFLAPFGTALAIYACWTLLNDDARRVFGRPPRAPR